MLEQRLNGFEQKRIYQDDVVPNQIKQRHVEARLVFSGLEADRPNGATEAQAYFATDTQSLFMWDGSAWAEINSFEDLSQYIIFFGDAADRPAAGGPTNFYWAQDTTTLSLWDGATWQEIVLPISVVSDPWVELGASLTFDSDDDPTFVADTSVDLTGSISVGMKIRLVQTTTKYFIVTAISATQITLYGGVNYNLANAAITLPYYSVGRAPFGFPLDPAGWTVTLDDAGAVDTVTSATWVNMDSLSINIPIGAWSVSYRVGEFMTYDVADNSLDMRVTLTQTDETEDDAYWTTQFYIGSGVGGSTAIYGMDHVLTRPVTVAAKTTYYVNEYYDESTGAGTVDAVIAPVVVTAVCAYL